MAGVVFYHGAFTHRPCEVYPKLFRIENMRGANGITWAKKYVLEIGGDLVGPDGQELEANEVVERIAILDAAYANEHQNCGFIMQDGTTTTHTLLTNDPLNLTGNRIVYRSWEHLHPGELANTRSFAVRFEAYFRQNSNSVFSYVERTRKIGNGGPEWKLYVAANGTIQKEFIKALTKVVHITSGEVVSGIPLGPPPPLWPLEEQTWRRVVDVGTPVDHGHPTPKFTHYKTKWTYHFERLGPSPIVSPPRY